jgi:hypothetical protein
MKRLSLLLFALVCYTSPLLAQDFWEIINTPPDLTINSIETNSNEELFIGVAFPTQGGGILHKLPDKQNWDTILYLNNDVIGPIYIDDVDNIFAASGIVYFSDNNGLSWSQIFETPMLGINSVFKSSVGSVFVGFWGGIYKSDSIGSDFYEVLLLENHEVVNAIIEDTMKGELFAGTINFFGGGGVYRSTDGGNTWEHFGLTDHYVSSLAINSTGDLFAGTRGHDSLGTGGVFKLPFGHTEWINLSSQELATSIAINSEDEIYIGCSLLDWNYGGVRVSKDNGVTWEDMDTGMGRQDIEKLALGSDEHLYALAVNSETPLFKTVQSTITSQQEVLADNSIITYNYPNPFTNETTISYTLHSNETVEVEIAIYNSHGEQVNEMIIPENCRNEHSIKFNAAFLPAGIYYYKLTNGNRCILRKMVLLK